MLMFTRGIGVLTHPHMLLKVFKSDNLMFPMNIGIEVEGPWPKTSSVGPLGSSKAFGKPSFGFSLSFLRNVPEGTLDANGFWCVGRFWRFFLFFFCISTLIMICLERRNPPKWQFEWEQCSSKM